MQKHLVPAAELARRQDRCRELLQAFIPRAEGIFLFSRLNIYYFTGTFANGLLWLPLLGDPILFCRRGMDRARLETPLATILPFTSYAEIGRKLTLPGQAAAEMNGLSWTLANSLTRHLAACRFLPGDRIIAMTRAEKSPWELELLRQAGGRHARCLTKLLPPLLGEGMSELEICHRISELYYREGHQGILRMENFGEEAFLGHIAIGDSANYPSVFNGPVGLRGLHPAVPHMGSPDIRWSVGELLTIDNGFTLAGYMTDKTQVYWLGSHRTIPTAIHRAHNFCIEMQARIAAQLKPGVLPSTIWQECLAVAARSEWSPGFMGLGNNKVAFVGHGIGLAIDEYPVLATGFDLPLAAGMVLAIEPKIGIPGVGMVGVENTFEVTSSGGRSLTGEHSDIITV